MISICRFVIPRATYLSRCAHNQVTLLEQTQVSTALTGQAHDLLAALQVSKFLLPLCDTQVYHVLERLDTDRPGLFSLAPQTQQSELGADRLATTSWRTDEDIVVRRVQRLEDLRLDLVEGLNSRRVNALEFFIMERR